MTRGRLLVLLPVVVLWLAFVWAVAAAYIAWIATGNTTLMGVVTAIGLAVVVPLMIIRMMLGMGRRIMRLFRTKS